MCHFWSAIIDRNGKVYYLGEIVSHEKIIEYFKLKDNGTNFCRIEIPVLNGFEMKPETDWKVKIDEKETPVWLTEEMQSNALKTFSSWNKIVFQKKWKQFKKLNAKNELLAKKTGEQIIYRERLLPSHEKLIIKYYLLGEKTSWASVRDSVRASVLDSVWASVRDSVRASVLDSVWASVRASVLDSVWASVLDSVWASVLDSVWASVRNSNKPYPLALPKKIFDLGYIHCLITEKDGISKINVFGKKGILLKKIDFKDKKGKMLVK